MEFREFKEKLFNRAKNEGFQECEIYFTNRESLNITVYEEEVEKYNLNKTFGLSFRGKIQEKMGYSYTEIMDEEAIEMLVKNAKDDEVKKAYRELSRKYHPDSYANNPLADLAEEKFKELLPEYPLLLPEP